MTNVCKQFYTRDLNEVGLRIYHLFLLSDDRNELLIQEFRITTWYEMFTKDLSDEVLIALIGLCSVCIEIVGQLQKYFLSCDIIHFLSFCLIV